MTDTTQRIRALQERHGWSQAELGEYLGVPQPTVSNWLLPETNPNRRSPGNTVVRLLDVFERLEMLSPAVHAAFLPAPVVRVRKKHR